MHRHQSDLQRWFLRGLKALEGLGRWRTQVEVSKGVKPSRPWSAAHPAAARPARNEAKPAAARRALEDFELVEDVGYSEVNVSITPPLGYKRRQ